MSNFTYLYVLVSKPGDTYYEQTLVSAASLRYYMPDANIVLLTDDKTFATLVGKRSEIKKYVTSIKKVELSDEMSNMQKSRWLKTSLLKYVDSDFLFIDSDTIVMQKLNDIESIDVDFGAVLDKHSFFSKHCNRALIEENARKLGFEPCVNDRHFNSGVMLVRNNKKNKLFFQMWHNLWLETAKKGVFIDQIALAQANYLMNGVICELPGVWNCQVEYGMHLIADAKILHMFVINDKFNRRPHVFMNSFFYKRVEKEGLSEDVLNMAKTPLCYFKEKNQLIGGEAVDYYNSYLSRFCCLLYCYSLNTRKVFFLLDFFSKLIMRKLKKMIG